MGVDLARLQDFTVIIVLDSDGNMVYMDRFNQIDWNVQKERIKSISKDIIILPLATINHQILGCLNVYTMPSILNN